MTGRISPISFKPYEYTIPSIAKETQKIETSVGETAKLCSTQIASSMLECHNVIIEQITFFIWLNEVDLQKAVKQLVNLESQIPLIIGDEEMLVPVGALVLYHLYMIQLNETPDQIKDDPLYSLMAYTNSNGCASTVLQRMRAGRRARAEVLLYALEHAWKAQDLRIGQSCFTYLRDVGAAMDADPEDYTKELGAFNLDSRDSLESHLKQIKELRQTLKKKWNLP